jgi:hypothetical protein
MAGPRRGRELSEMVDQLERRLNKLDAFAQAAFAEGREEFLPEVATRLRVLLVRSRHNRPSLLEVASALGIPLTVTLDGPRGVRWSPEEASPQAGAAWSLAADL